MSTKYKFHNPDGTYFVTFAVVHWIDVFTRNAYRELFLGSLKYCQDKKGLRIHAYVLMTNHVHLIISTTGDPLQHIMRDLKKFTSVKLIEAIRDNPSESRKRWLLKAFRNAGEKNSNNRIYQFWRQDNHPIEIRSNKMFDQKLNYIHNNPVEHGFVARAEDYPWSSMVNFMRGSSVNGIEIFR